MVWQDFPLPQNNYFKTIEMASKSTELTMAAISATIPNYNPVNIQVWFSQLNALFSAKKVTSQTEKKNEYIVEKLPCELR